MDIAQLISDFFLSQWLWSFTWDMYHVPLAMVFMILFGYLFTRKSFTKILFVSCSGPLVAFFSFNVIVMTVFVYSLGFNYEPGAQNQAHCFILKDCLWLAFIYSILQSIYFMALNSFYLLNLKRMALVTILAHTSTAFLMNIFISRYHR